ncbi:MerR family transcriptional regulator [Aestuariirhabdus sp. LZHN29]|uniref:MerR family transcriptional regulator n=1 Tax=Aestuariirhabdus sp. LZHN29 TaxID=3417462 RepID=UPI003CF69871
MQIGELAKRTGVRASAIRFYERRGLLPAADRSGNGYRHYPPSAVMRLQMIQYAQNLGLPLDQIATMVGQDTKPQEQKAALRARLQQREEEITAMQQLLANQQHHVQLLLGTLDRYWSKGSCVPLAELERLASATADRSPPVAPPSSECSKEER